MTLLLLQADLKILESIFCKGIKPGSRSHPKGLLSWSLNSFCIQIGF
jgi:hypothetical protein